MASKLLLFMAAILILSIIPAVYSEGIGSVGVQVSQTNYDPSPAKPGKYVTLFLKAENSGTTEAKNVIFELELEYPFSFKPGEEATKSIVSMGSEEAILLEYDLLVDKNALAGTYTEYLKLCLDSQCESFAKTPLTITVQTGGTPKIEVGLETSDTFSSGTKGTVTVHIVNRGLLDTKFLVVELQPADEYEIISPSRLYIGELQSDDFETADFTIYMKENIAVDQSETITLPVLLEYSDTNDKEYSETSGVDLRVYSKTDLAKLNLMPTKGGAYQQILLIIVGLAAVFILYRWYKKKSSS